MLDPSFTHPNSKEDLFTGTDLIRERLLDLNDFLWLETGNCKGASPSRFPVLAGLEMNQKLEINTIDELPLLQRFVEENKGQWIFGHFTYESRFLLEPSLSTFLVPEGNFAPISFFVPRFVWNPSVYGNSVWVQDENRTISPGELLSRLAKNDSNVSEEMCFEEKTLLTEEGYNAALEKIFGHLHRGDIYEMNYCIPFMAQGNMPDPVNVWKKMQLKQQAPFGALYRRNHNWLLCSSPERWLMKSGNTLISQPIKGTARRANDPQTDEAIKQSLLQSEKEKAENVMIVDLVRNDLGRIAVTGSVKVDELFGIYSFPNVHQMISTISAQLDTSAGFNDILHALFPMGSMTGAPKISAMEIIRKTEVFNRGLYSGSVGYIDPEGNFDFNVVIRSILYNEKTGSALFPAGSAITVHCDPKAEYHECLLKSNSMRSALELPLSD